MSSDSTPHAALRASIDLARATEALGFLRYWVAEHHSMPGIASSTPALLLGYLGEATSTMRLGSGGVMLPNHSPLVVAEQFGMLETMHPGRIDLGLGRAPGTDQVTAHALRRTADMSADDFPQELAELMAFLDDSFPEDHPYRRIKVVPPGRPDIWLLGSSGYSAQLAGVLGLPFSFAHHFSSKNTDAALELYRSSFKPSEVLDRPYAMVTAAVVCADTTQEAERQAAPMGLSMLQLRKGRPGPLPTPEEALAYPYTPQDLAIVAGIIEDHVIGDQETVGRGLAELRERTQADEIMISTNVGDPKARLRSFELIAEAHPDALRPVGS
ncbi:MAG: class flavin-dependent oxidoreductase [Streptosporangiaceae bacterium]|nr:class flavin-dependent oxidoreductase [Streptosporangiaceae bacterium]